MTQSVALQNPTQPLVDLLQDELRRYESEHFVGPDGDRAPTRVWDRALFEPLREFLSRPGKEFRARLVEAGFQLGRRRQVLSAMPAELPLLVEILHAGSLIIDDIEDESGYRRGAQALHCMVGTPIALNAGNWMYFWPGILLDRMDLGPSVELALRRHFARTMFRCHNGQALDVATRVGELEQDEVRAVVATTTSLKTGTLMELAAVTGAIAAGASSERVKAVGEFAQRLGVGLQMLDDLGGITSEQRRHKGHEDLIHARPTWPWAWAADRLNSHDFAELQALGRRVASRDRHPEYLAEALRTALGDHPKRVIKDWLDEALSTLSQHVGGHVVVRQLRQEIDLLEKSYE